MKLHILLFALISYGSCKVLTNTDEARHPIQKRDILTDPGRTKPDWDALAQATLDEAIERKPIYKPAKNVIFFLGDGMGVSTVTAARFFKAQYVDPITPIPETSFSWEKYMPYTGIIKTYAADAIVTGSASAATAFLCGQKANVGTVCVNQDVPRGDCDASVGNKLTSNIHRAINDGRWAGVVTTATITDATPATAYSNVAERYWAAKVPPEFEGTCTDIASQLIDNEINKELRVILGGGRRDFYPDNETDPEDNTKFGRRIDGRYLTTEWLNERQSEGCPDNKCHYVTKKSDFDAVDPNTEEYLLGLFESGDMQYETDRKAEVGEWQEPSLVDMTEKALTMLQRAPDGYFLLVEGARIDHAHHDNNAFKSMEDTIAFDKAIAKAVSMTDEQDTLIVVTADHSLPFNIGGDTILEADIMGLSYSIDGNLQKASDDKPWTILSYHNGPGYFAQRTANGSISTAQLRQDLEGVDTTNPEFLQDAQVPKSSSTHSGEDVTLYARGPMAHLLQGHHEQNYIAHAVRYIACLDDPRLCNKTPPPPMPCHSKGKKKCHPKKWGHPKKW